MSSPESPDPVEILRSVAQDVRDPLTGISVADSGMLSDMRMEDDVLCMRLSVTEDHREPMVRSLVNALGRAVTESGWNGPIECSVAPGVTSPPEAATPSAPAPGNAIPSTTAPPRPNPDAAARQPLPNNAPRADSHQPRPIPGVGHVLAVASGKGGVGKSTVAVQLAMALKDLGSRVGLLDLDFYGPSIPTMMGIRQKQTVSPQKRILPATAHGLACVSLGLMLDDGKPLVWRGGMIAKMVEQLLDDVDWGQLDYLVIDLPPGTGDAQLTLAQQARLSGSVVVSTPQSLALKDAERGLEMFRGLDVPVLGLVENMAWYPLPDGSRDYVFGQGGTVELAERSGVPVLARIPMDAALRLAGDQGDPGIARDGSAFEAFNQLAKAVVETLHPPA